MSLFNLGDFTLSSGLRSDWKIDCDYLNAEDRATLVELVYRMVQRWCGGFSKVEGVPRGGLWLAEMLASHTDPKHETVLLVDDVWTTGKSMKVYREKIRERDGYDVKIAGAVLFSRGDCSPWVQPLFQLDSNIIV